MTDPRAQDRASELRDLLVRADSYLSLLWHRPSTFRDTELTFDVERTIADLRRAYEQENLQTVQHENIKPALAAPSTPANDSVAQSGRVNAPQSPTTEGRPDGVVVGSNPTGVSNVAAPSTPPETQIEQLIEQHARVAVLPIQAQNDSYQPTPYEANALKNFRYILRKFTDDLASLLASVRRQP